MTGLETMGKKAKEASYILQTLPKQCKNVALEHAADNLLNRMQEVLEANRQDVESAKKQNLKNAFIDRLTLNEKRIEEMAQGLRQIAKLPDPVGEIVMSKTLPNGLMMKQIRVPMGVIGIIFEARPNVASDAFGLCLKAGSAVLLRGGKDALLTNHVIVSIFREALKRDGLPADIVQLIEDISHESVKEMMKLKEYIDLLIPRGGAGLIRTVVENSTVPVIQTGVGNCHIFVDDSANQESAISIILNAKTQRPGVCNACETLLVHEAIAPEFLPKIGKALQEQNVEIRGDIKTVAFVKGAIPATEEDWSTEYADLIISIKVVQGIDEAIEHIRKYSTGHSEAILTETYKNSKRFLNEVDSAAVYVNASTRFTDGGEFGFGAEIGISTQKLHARGPMGLKELTTKKYTIYGNGQIRK